MAYVVSLHYICCEHFYKSYLVLDFSSQEVDCILVSIMESRKKPASVKVTRDCIMSLHSYVGK